MAYRGYECRPGLKDVIASAAKQSIARRHKNGLLRCARNDGHWLCFVWYPSNQILFGDDFAEPCIIRDEFLDEFVHAVLENIVHVAVLQAVTDAAGVTLPRPLA